MKLLMLLPLFLFLVTTLVQAEERWKSVDEGFRFTIPTNWKKQKVHPIDSNCGTYKARTADLEYDETFGIRIVSEDGRSLVDKWNTKEIDQLKNKETNPKLLEPGEEIWRIDGRIAKFTNGKVDPAEYGKRRFTNVARLHVPYENEPGNLEIYILYKSEADLPTVRQVLKSITWKKPPS